MFVFNILQIPSGCIQNCSRCIAPTWPLAGVEAAIMWGIVAEYAMACIDLKAKSIWEAVVECSTTYTELEGETIWRSMVECATAHTELQAESMWTSVSEDVAA